VIQADGASPEEIAAIVAALQSLRQTPPPQEHSQISPWKLANLYPDADIDALRLAQGKRIVL
jgi:hypothetical protein